jgi:excisionase family DNA binding protein
MTWKKPPTAVNPDNEFLRVAQLCTILNVSPTSVYDLLKRGVIPSARFAGAIRVKRVDLETYIADNTLPAKRKNEHDGEAPHNAA